MDQICLDPQDKLPLHPPTPRTHCQQNSLPPHRTKKCLRPTPPLRIISGTALRSAEPWLRCSGVVMAGHRRLLSFTPGFSRVLIESSTLHTPSKKHWDMMVWKKCPGSDACSCAVVALAGQIVLWNKCECAGCGVRHGRLHRSIKVCGMPVASIGTWHWQLPSEHRKTDNVNVYTTAIWMGRYVKHTLRCYAKKKKNSH